MRHIVHVFLLIVTLVVLPIGAFSSTATAPPPPLVLYTPNALAYRAPYASDQANAALESWPDYWSWVQQFYNGNFFDAGWTSHSQDVLAHYPLPSPLHDIILRKLNRLGFEISREWSKDNSIRKVNTNDLESWSSQITTAVGADTGDGSTVISCLNRIEKEVTAKEAVAAANG